MIGAITMRLGLALLAAVPVERIVAWAVNRLLTKLDGDGFDRAQKTAAHLIELADLMSDILADKQVTPEEATAARAAIVQARERLLAAWAEGRPAKGLQTLVSGASYGEASKARVIINGRES